MRIAIDGMGGDHAPAEIQAIWKEMNALVESRGAKPGLTFTEVAIVGRGDGQKP